MTKTTAVSATPLPFARRHIGPSPDQIREMLETLGAASLDELIEETIPISIRQRERLEIGPALSESEALERARRDDDADPSRRGAAGHQGIVFDVESSLTRRYRNSWL